MSGEIPPVPPALTEPAKPKTSALAIWSLILGILSIFTCGLTSLPGLITGILGVIAAGDTSRGLAGRGLAIGGIATSALSLLLVIPLALALPAYSKVSESAKLTLSASKARQLVLVLREYALEHDGLLPPDLKTALENAGIIDPRLLSSPLGDDSAEYILLKPNVKVEELPPETPILRDPHARNGKTVVGCADGSVKVVLEEEL